MRARARASLTSFDIPAFRWLVLSNYALWGAWTVETLTQGWLVLELTDSPFWVGAAVGVRGINQLVFSLVGGAIADRVDRRHLLIVANFIGAAGALAVAVLVVGGWIELWHVLVSLAVAGVVSAIVNPTFSALTFDVVGPARILTANAFYFMGGAVLRVAAALVAGFALDRLGVGPSYLLVAAIYALGAASVWPLKAAARELHTEPALRAMGSGLRYALGTPAIRSALYLSLITEIFGFAYMFMMPVLARDVLVVGATGLGALTAAAAAGQFLAMVALASLGDVRRKGALLVGSTLGFGLAVAGFSLSPWFALSLVLAAAVGATASLYDSSMATTLQVTVSTEMRGRVLGLYAATWGSSQLGGFAVGALATVVSVPLALALFGAVVAANALWFVPRADAFARVPAPVDQESREPA